MAENPFTTPMPIRDHSLTIDFIPARDYETMKDGYNSCFHTDMQHVGQCEYDGVDTWIDAVRSFMKQPPWGVIEASGTCLEEVKEIGNLVQVDASRLERATKNSIYIPSLISKIDQCIAKHRQETSSSSDTPIFCRTNECSMKQSTSYTVRPFTCGAEILDQLLRDRRLISWLASDRYNIKSTNIYLSDFDTSFASTNEYRVFVWKGKTTGISQYRWFPTEETQYHTEEEARQISKDILRFMEGNDGLISQLKNHKRNQEQVETEDHMTRQARTSSSHFDIKDNNDVVLVADVVHTKGKVYLVEINLFGGETGCGSSLFHWKRDEQILYGNGQNVVCRFLSRS